MPRWFEGPLAAFDAQTTGGDVEQDRIVSAALVVQREAASTPEPRRWLVSPGVPVPKAASARHGLTDAHLQRYGRWPAPVMDEAARALAEQAARGYPLVVVDAPFALTLLDRELRRHRNSTLKAYLSGCALWVLDPRVLDHHVEPGREARRALADLCARYGVESDSAYDPGADAVAALGVARELGRRFAASFEGLGPAELHARQTVWYTALAEDPASRRHGVPTEHHGSGWPLRPALSTAA